MNELRYLEFIFNMAAISPFISTHWAKYLPKILKSISGSHFYRTVGLK